MQHFARHAQQIVVIAAIALALVAGDSVRAFLEPTAPAPGNNVFAPLHTGAAGQIKEGAFGANQIATASRLCFGPFSCVDKWWDSAQNTCRLDVKKVNSYSANLTAGGTADGVTDSTCNHYLSATAKAAGWVAVGSDQCVIMADRDCQRPVTCIYMRMKCGGSIISQLPTKSPAPGIENHPVSGLTQ